MFHSKNEALVSFVVHNFWTPEGIFLNSKFFYVFMLSAGKIILELNGMAGMRVRHLRGFFSTFFFFGSLAVGEYNMAPNEFGETRVHVGM